MLLVSCLTSPCLYCDTTAAGVTSSAWASNPFVLTSITTNLALSAMDIQSGEQGT